MNSLERTMAAISHTEPDRVPLFLLLSLYGAKELQMPVRQYFSQPANVVKAQLLMREKYSNDCIYTFFYAPIEVEAFGGEVIFVDDGPPNSGRPIISSLSDIASLELPVVEDTPCLKRVLEATAMLKAEVGDTVPLIGVVMSPYSLPVMQMGFEKYLELIYDHPDEFDALMRLNEEFCVAWANAQLAAGATAICYFNPLSSPNMIERERYLVTGYPVDQRTIARINGPTATHLASGIALPVIDDIIALGSAVLGFSERDDLSAIKEASRGRICLLGNLNGIDMVNWSPAQAENAVKRVITAAGAGGGLILSDNHGEIPWQVKEETLLAIGEAVRTHGTYPLLRV
jgi:uroporphyrinogen decarboxylase